VCERFKQLGIISSYANLVIRVVRVIRVIRVPRLLGLLLFELKRFF
jgi:hypothetical protein